MTRTRTRTRVLATPLAALLAVFVVTGCTTAEETGSQTPDTQSSIARPAGLAELAEVQLTAPASQHAGTSPVFGWNPIEGAYFYRLSLLTDGGPLWAWEGTQTSVRLGGYTAEPAPGATALRLTEPGWWSVSALDYAGELIAISALFAISPDERAPAPLAPPRPGTGASSDSASAGANDVCSLLTEEEVTAHLGGALLGPGVASEGGGGRYHSCEWGRVDDEFATLRVGVTTGATQAGWDESLEAIREAHPDFATGVPGLGSNSYVTANWSGVKVQVLHGDTHLSVTSGMAAQYQQEVVDLAALVLSRLAGAGS